MSKKKIVTAWQHDRLAEDLALAIDTPYLNIPLGSVWSGQTAIRQHRRRAIANATAAEDVLDALELPVKGTQLADVVAVKPSYVKFCLSIYEVKISRADFQSDLRSGKYKGYLPHCHRLYFATPAGMVTKEEIPAEVGWIVRSDTGWKVMKGAPSRDVSIPETTMMSLIFKKKHLTVRERRVKNILAPYTKRENALKIIGKDLAEAWACREKYRNLADKQEYLNDRLRVALRDGLGLDEDAAGLELTALNGLIRQFKQKTAEMGIEVGVRAIPRQKPKESQE